MNKQSSLVIAASLGIDPRTDRDSVRAFVLTMVMLAGIEVEAQAFTNTGVRDQISEKRPRLSR